MDYEKLKIYRAQGQNYAINWVMSDGESGGHGNGGGCIMTTVWLLWWYGGSWNGCGHGGVSDGQIGSVISCQ